jgi:hypothetical protein
MKMKTMNPDSRKLDNFVLFPRKILTALRAGEITKNEYIVYSYLRLSGSPYGIAVASLDNIRNDIFQGKVSVNYCDKLVLSLKSKRYIYYHDRRGRRGSFDVDLGDWILPTKAIKTLDKFFDGSAVRGLEENETDSSSEARPTLVLARQTFNEQKECEFKGISDFFDDVAVRASNNDTQKEKDKDDNRSKMPLKGRWDLKEVSSFIPSNTDEQICLQIATTLREPHINSVLALLKKHGIRRLESAYGIYREDVEKGKPIKNAGAYFQGIVENSAIQDRSP